VAQLVVHDINNFLTVIGSGLRLLEGQSDSADQKVIVAEMQQAISRGALLSRQLLEGWAAMPDFMGRFVAGSHLAALAGSLDQALRSDITVRTEIAPDLWDFNADPEELYFVLLNLCRNSADAMPDGGTITVAARNVEPSAGAARGFVEIVVADDGEGMPEEVLSQALTPYFTTKAAAGGTGLGLVQVQRFAERQGGTIGMVSEQGGLDRAIEHLVVASDPRTLGEMRKHFHGDLRGKIIGELAKDFSRRPLEDIASLIADA